MGLEDQSTQQNILKAAVRTLDLAVLARSTGSSVKDFVLSGPTPPWFEATFGSPTDISEESPFLEDFIAGSGNDCWQGDGLEERSELWQENSRDDQLHYFQATALREGEFDILIISNVTERYQQDQKYLQHVHNTSLHQRKLAKEHEKRQILLDCIIRELGSPVSTILLNVQFAKDKLERPDLREALERAEAQAERQRNLIHSVTHHFQSDLADLESNILERTSISLMSLASATIQQYRAVASQKEVSINLSPTNDPYHVVANEGHLQRIFNNVLEYSVSSSPTSASVTVALERKADRVRAIFSNKGERLSEEKQTALFRPFNQSLCSTSDERPSLALYFCKMALEALGGTIDITSSPEGNEIWFELPSQSKNKASVSPNKRES